MDSEAQVALLVSSRLIGVLSLFSLSYRLLRIITAPTPCLSMYASTSELLASTTSLML